MNLESYKIICTDYPSEFILDKNLAKVYFKQFGKLKRVTFKPKLRICTVEYANEEGYLEALSNAGKYKGTTFTVTTSIEKMKSEKKLDKRKETVWVDKDEIEAELEAMSGQAPKEYKHLEGNGSHIRDLKFEKTPKLKRSWKSDMPTKSKQVVKHLKSIPNNRISGEELDLINLVLSQAITIDDKYRILDARDKLIKLKLKKNLTVKSGSTVGICPDMCPEKERLFREIKHQVAWYEQDNDKNMNHNRAVKQYSRSSADQEAPLAHELRPVTVLQMTMGYLLHNIIDLCDTDEVHIGEWYYFLWDRTRGIRKDITQQELCSQGAVELVEQCARFHIHCSARLVAEDPSVFDQKINTENLTKCLQTLKYMYHDLLLKGESCENEAEFRAYIILLNLNDGNFMWEVQQLRPEIQKSREVRFALQVHSAIDKNNYVQFFKLVHLTTYLNACILMRYFVQVRIMALKTLLKCYIPRASKTAYPLVELQSILAFDDIELTSDFLQYYGLNINEECTRVILDKNNFFSPEFPYILDRSTIVEDKRTFSIGRLICGADLPPKSYLIHKVHNSFDNKGYLINKDIVDELDLEKVKLKLLEELNKSKVETIDTGIKELKNTSFTFGQKEKVNQIVFTEKEQITNPFALTTKQSGSIFATKEIAPFETRSIFSSPKFTFQSPAQSHSTSGDQPDFVSKNKDIFPAIPKPIEDKKGGFAFDLIQPIVTTNNTESPKFPITSIVSKLPQIEKDLEKKMRHAEIQKRVEEEKLKLIEQKKVELKTQEEQNKILAAKLEEERRQKEFKKKRQEVLLQKRLEEMRNEEEQLKVKKINNTVKNVLNSLVDQVENKIREEKLYEINEKIQRRKLIKIIAKWRFNVSKNKRKRKAIDCSPIWINKKTLEQSAKELHTSSQKLTLNLMKRYKYGKSLDIGQLLDEQIEIVNIYQLTYSTLKNRTFELLVNKPKNIFWKVLISLPDKSELVNGLNRIQETMDSAFPWKKINEQMLYLEHIKPNALESVIYCVEKQQGYNVKHFDSNGIIFIAKNFNANLQRRIFENLKGFGVYTKIPIVIILQEYNQKDCKLQELIKENIVSNYIILIENVSGVKLLSLVEQGLVFLAKHIERGPSLELDTLKSFMTKYLCSEIWKRANSFAKWNSDYKKCLQNPNIVLSLYNEGLNKLNSIILNGSNKEYAVFPEEFKKYLNSETPDFLPCSYSYFPNFWNSKSYLNKLEDILKTFNLPYWNDVWPPINQNELEISVFKYCSKITKEPEKLFYKAMSIFLRNIDPSINFKNIQYILWTDIVELFGLEKLSNENLNLSGIFNSQTIFKEYFVVYDLNILNKYRFSDWFYIYNPIIKKFLAKELEKNPIKEVKKAKEEDITQNFKLTDDFIASIRNNYLLNKPDKSGMLKELSQLKESIKDLTTAVAIHKKISSTLEVSLSTAIAEK